MAGDSEEIGEEEAIAAAVAILRIAARRGSVGQLHAIGVIAAGPFGRTAVTSDADIGCTPLIISIIATTPAKLAVGTTAADLIVAVSAAVIAAAARDCGGTIGKMTAGWDIVAHAAGFSAMQSDMNTAVATSVRAFRAILRMVADVILRPGTKGRPRHLPMHPTSHPHQMPQPGVLVGSGMRFENTLNFCYGAIG